MKLKYDMWEYKKGLNECTNAQNWVQKIQMFQMSLYFIVYSGTSIEIVFTNQARKICLKFCDIVFVMGKLLHWVNWLQRFTGDRQIF